MGSELMSQMIEEATAAEVRRQMAEERRALRAYALRSTILAALLAVGLIYALT